MKPFVKIIVILGLLLVILAIVGGALLLFDYLEVIDARSTLNPVLSRLGISEAILTNQDSPQLLAQAREQKRLQGLDEQRMKLAYQEREIEKQKENLSAKEAELQNVQEQLDEEKRFLQQEKDRYLKKRQNLAQIAQQLNNMPPQQAVGQLNEMDRYQVVDVLRRAEELALENKKDSLVPYWLSLMSNERSAELADLMISKP